MKRVLVVFLCLFVMVGAAGFSAEKKETSKNLFPQGNMEKIKIVPEKDPNMMAVPARENADGWCGNPKDCLEIVKDAHSGKYALAVKSKDKPVWVNCFVPLKISEGTLSFYYKVVSPVKEGTLIFHMVPWSWASLEVGQRQTVYISLKEAGDGKWHKAQTDFSLSQPCDGVMLAPRIGSENASAMQGDWIIDDIEICEKVPAKK